MKKPIPEKFKFRTIRPEETKQAINIEQICFPPHEACSAQAMEERIDAAADLFLVAIDKESGKIAGFLNGIATDEHSFRDEFFKDASLHHADGKNIMLLGLDVHPEHQRQGLAHEIVDRYMRRERERGRKTATLTCLHGKVSFYEKMGFVDRGISNSSWGGEVWHEMTYILNR